MLPPILAALGHQGPRVIPCRNKRPDSVCLRSARIPNLAILLDPGGYHPLDLKHIVPLRASSSCLLIFFNSHLFICVVVCMPWLVCRGQKTALSCHECPGETSGRQVWQQVLLPTVASPRNQTPVVLSGQKCHQVISFVIFLLPHSAQLMGPEKKYIVAYAHRRRKEGRPMSCYQT